MAKHLNRLKADTFWKQATGAALVGRLVGRLVDTTLHAPTTQRSVSPSSASRLWVHRWRAARARSTTTTPTVAPGGPAPAEAAVPAS
ncbi:hypothetical protein ACFWNQ_10330 [Streptomyces virginiae]|uniref:hypothetical protein n=1 Tax=Streptomyces virginiae TaxID=1961 RepID=UPI0036599B8A